MPAAAGQDQWEDITPGPVVNAAAARAPKAAAAKDDEWEDAIPQTFAPGSYQTKPGGEIKTAPAQAPATPLERVGEITMGTRHPIDDTVVALKSWRDKPLENLGQLAGDTARVLPNMARDILTRPVETATSVSGGKQFSEDIANKRYGAAAADMGAGIVNTVGPVLLGGPEAMEATGDASLRTMQRVGDVGEKSVQSVKDSIGRATRIEPTVDTVSTRGNLDAPKRPGTLKPGIRAAASVARVVGGPEIVNAILPEHPVKIGPFSRLPNRIPVPEPELPGVGASLPDASEFYKNEGAERAAILKRTQMADKQAAREAAQAAKSKVVIAGQEVPGAPRNTGSEGRPATWTNDRVIELAGKGNRAIRDAITQVVRRGLPMPENARYIMGDEDLSRAVSNPREVTRFTPEGVPIRNVDNPVRQQPSSRARIQIVEDSVGREEAPNSQAQGVEQPIAAKSPAVERRQQANEGMRRRVSEMNPEEMQQELLTSKTTGLPNRRAFDEAGDSPAVGMSDADGLKAVNDKFGYEAGNALLKAKADALREVGLEAYHDKGDEFLYRGASPEELQQKLERAREILKNQSIIEVEKPDGTVLRFKGADFSYGNGKDISEAETGLKAHKAEREASGERARGELRGIVRLGPE